jgi:tyrosyl-tRNA synthetase
MDQAFKVLHEDRTIVRYNSEWFEEMDFGDCLNLARKMTVARMLERDDFHKRYQENSPISIIEFLYPLVQGYDSVMLKADIELGGSDQLFNMLVGRQLQKEAGQPEQCVITMPLLVGLDGKKKMSKSLNNYIAFNDTARDMFGKIMSISDDAMWPYYELLLEMTGPQLENWKREHPMAAKKNLATSLVSQFFSMQTAKAELENFESVFSKGNRPEEMPEVSWHETFGDAKEAPLIEILDRSGQFESKGEIRRLIKQGAVRVEGERIDESELAVRRPKDRVIEIQAGKRKFLRLQP